MTQDLLTDIPIIIPAAGQSRRMRGTDKLMLDVEGEPLLRRQIRRARAATRGTIIVALPAPPHPRHGCLSGLDVTGLDVPDAAEGMSAGLRRAFAALDDGCAAAMVLLPDLPDLTTADIARVLSAVDPGSGTRMWCATTPDGRAGHPIVVHHTLFDALRDLRGDTGARALREQAARDGVLRGVALEDDRARRDLDTPEAWARWREARKKR